MKSVSCRCIFHKFYKRHFRWYKTLAIKFLKISFFYNWMARNMSRYVAKQDAPEKEGNVPHNSCKTNLIAID